MNQPNQLFLILLRLKSYLIGLIDNPNECNENLQITEEYLDRKFPLQKNEILELLNRYGIYNDCQIVFDNNIQAKFKEIATNKEEYVEIDKLLEELEIDSEELKNKERQLDIIKEKRNQHLKEIVGLILQLAKGWSAHSEIAQDVDDFTLLDEEEVLRPDEKLKLDALDTTNSASFANISILTKRYLRSLVDYYFAYGGNIPLEKFVDDSIEILNNVSIKYEKLKKDSGLNEN